jgi:D-alanyl-lipoteichoic acid acyltransferase DltB (MBOAT superfamily)
MYEKYLKPGDCILELFSLHFLLFLVASLAAYHMVGHFARKHSWLVLLAASLAFYCLVGRWQTLAYMLACAAVTWAAPLALARMDARCKEERAAAPGRAARRAVKAAWAGRRRAVLVAALLACFGILAYLKYWNVLLYEVGLAASPASLGLLLPLGISFYTFQSVSYLVDAYNGRFEPQRNFLKHLLFVSWFPQVIQGPINRYEQLSPQLLEYHETRSVRYDRAILRFCYGALKKIAIANMLVGVIEAIFSNVTTGIPGSVVVFGILLYSAQQYGDFSGGIDMVEAASSLFGVGMAENFRRPYFSVSLADFWRRWHITLGTWMRDYVFFPFAVSRPMRALGARASQPRGAPGPHPARLRGEPPRVPDRGPLARRGAPLRGLGPLQRRGDRAGRPPRPGLPPRERGTARGHGGLARTASSAWCAPSSWSTWAGTSTASTTSATACSACATPSPTSTPARFSSRCTRTALRRSTCSSWRLPRSPASSFLW